MIFKNVFYLTLFYGNIFDLRTVWEPTVYFKHKRTDYDSNDETLVLPSFKYYYMHQLHSEFSLYNND